MGSLNSKRNAPVAQQNGEGNSATKPESKIGELNRSTRIAYFNQCVSSLRDYKKIPEFLLVRKKKTELLMDEDGYTANAFYEQVTDKKNGRERLVRRTGGLKPIEFVDYKIPRLDCNLNLVLWETPCGSIEKHSDPTKSKRKHQASR